jgi:hypothetical protein
MAADFRRRLNYSGVNMAKCAMCGSRKGQRQCKWENGLVCSLCCGQHRNAEKCEGCVYYKEPKPVTRNYGVVPRFSTQTMDDDLDLQSIANAIESTLCLWDRSCKGTLKDDSALQVLESLLDLYYFKDTVEITEEPVKTGYQMVLDVILYDLSDIPEEKIVRILGVVHFVAQRRAKGGRDYFDVINQYVGVRAAPGVRILKF